MRFRIGEKTYTAAAVDRLTLRQLIQVEGETEQMGRRMTWVELREIADRVSRLDKADAAMDPDWPWFLGLIVWASRVDSGEAITFGEAVDFPLDDFQIIPDPADHREAQGPQKARPGSGQAGSRGGAGGKGKKKRSGKR